MNPTLTTYEPPVSENFNPTLHNYWESAEMIAPGVRGIAFEERGTIFIPLIIAEDQGNGDVGRFLDRLSGRCAVLCVTSGRLQGMLLRRDFRPGIELVAGEYTDAWRRPK
jgi:hypothetical protein